MTATLLVKEVHWRRRCCQTGDHYINFLNLCNTKLIECCKRDGHLCCRADNRVERARLIRLFLNKPLKTSEDEDYSSQLFFPQLEQCPPDYLRELKNPALLIRPVSSHCSVCGCAKEQLRKFHVGRTMRMRRRGNSGEGSFVLFNRGSSFFSIVHFNCNTHHTGVETISKLKGWNLIVHQRILMNIKYS